MALNKHQIFASNDLKESFVEVPEWGGKVRIRALSVQEQLDYDEFLQTNPKEVDMAIQLIITATINDDGKKTFSKEDIPSLKEKSLDNLFRVVDAILKLNKQSPQDVDELAKNS
jgi:hypothetical protein